jgi:hypothetical protein
MTEVDINTDLATQQAALAAALVGNGLTPDGFDGERLALASKMLLRKRRHAAVAAWPAFAHGYGPNLERDFAVYAQAHPMAPGTTPREDLLGFAKYLQKEGRLPPAVIRLLCVAGARYFVPVRRGGFISIRVPLAGVISFRLPKLTVRRQVPRLLP